MQTWLNSTSQYVSVPEQKHQRRSQALARQSYANTLPCYIPQDRAEGRELGWRCPAEHQDASQGLRASGPWDLQAEQGLPRPLGGRGGVPLHLLPAPLDASGFPQHSPLQLLQGDCDPQAMAQDIECSQNVRPLHHLPQGPTLQDPRAEHVPGLLRQEADVDQDLGWCNTEG